MINQHMKRCLIHQSLCCAKPLQLCLTLRDPMNYSLPCSSVHGILQARTLEWVAMPSSRGSSQPRDQTHVSFISCIGRQVLYHQRHLGNANSQQGNANQNHNEIPLHAHQDVYNQKTRKKKKNRKQQVLPRRQRNWNPGALLVETENGTVTVENSMMVSQNI